MAEKKDKPFKSVDTEGETNSEYTARLVEEFYDARPKYLPDGSGKKWRGRPLKDPLSYRENTRVGGTGKKIEEEWRDLVPDGQRYSTEPYSGTKADLIYKEYYGKDTDRKLKEATEARFRPRPRYVPYTDKQRDLYLRYKKANRTPEQRSETYSRGKLLKDTLRNIDSSDRLMPQDASQRAKQILPVYRDEAADRELGKVKYATDRQGVAGLYNPSDRAILLPSRVRRGKRDDKQTLHHEVRHHMNMTNPEYTDKYISPNFPKDGMLASGKYVHAFYSPNELTEAIADLKQQDYKATGLDMTKERFNKLINAKELPAHFRKFFERSNAGHFIKALREWKKEDPKKGKSLIDQIIQIQKQVVDAGKSKFFSEQLA